MDRLAEYRTALFNGRRDRFPDNTIDRSSHFLFFVKYSNDVDQSFGICRNAWCPSRHSIGPSRD